MIPKMIRLALVLLAVLVMALEFPKIYKKTFEQRERRNMTRCSYVKFRSEEIGQGILMTRKR